MNAKRVIPTLTLSAACALGAAPIASAAAAEVQQASSGNWSGYVVAPRSQSDTFRTVTGSWVQPTAKCSAQDGATYGAFWVGLGGAGGREALEQDGTEVNCSADGTQSSYAWYELVPNAPVKVDLAVRPGDHMTATTTVDGHAVTETISNHTTGHTFSKTLRMADPDSSSAEWIAEAPSQCDGSVSDCSTLSLSDFGSVHFTGATATDSTGHTGSPSDGDWQTAALTLSGSSAAASDVGYGYGYGGDGGSAMGGGATPTGLSDGGAEFTVNYKGDSSTSTTGDGAGAGYGGAGDGYGNAGAGGYGGGDGYGSGGYGSGGGSGYAYGGGYPGGGYIVIYGG